jgi:hypothetical protein
MHSSYDTRTENRHRVELTWWGACQTAKKVKERFCYTCPDIAKEFAKYDKDQAKWVRQFQGVHPRTKEPWECDVGYERFLAPEVFFNPEICGGARGSGQIYKTPLSEMVYECVDKSAIDNRRGLFDNIVLSGGSSMFKDFDRRLQRDIQKICDNKSKRNEELTGVATKNPIKVNVNKHNFQVASAPRPYCTAVHLPSFILPFFMMVWHLLLLYASAAGSDECPRAALRGLVRWLARRVPGPLLPAGARSARRSTRSTQ